MMYGRHRTHSATKSFTSTLIGIAIDQGYIAGTDAPVFDYFPDYSNLWSALKGTITLEHLLKMSVRVEVV